MMKENDIDLIKLMDNNLQIEKKRKKDQVKAAQKKPTQPKIAAPKK